MKKNLSMLGKSCALGNKFSNCNIKGIKSKQG